LRRHAAQPHRYTENLKCDALIVCGPGITVADRRSSDGGNALCHHPSNAIFPAGQHRASTSMLLWKSTVP